MPATGKIKIIGDANSISAMYTKIAEDSSKSTKVVNTNTSSMSQQLDHFSNNIMKAGQILLKMGTEAKALERTNLQMTVLKRTNVDLFQQLQKTSEASFGLANAQDMVTSANKALSFGIDLSNGKFKKLVSLTTKVAAVMGTDAKNAFDDLIVGIARGSKQILDNLGVMVDITQINQDYALQLGVTVKQLTKQQKQSALTEEVIKQLGVTTSSVTEKMIKENSRASKGMKRLEGVWHSVKNSLLEGFNSVSEASEEWGNNMFDLVHPVIAAERNFRELQRTQESWYLTLKNAPFGTFIKDAENFKKDVGLIFGKAKQIYINNARAKRVIEARNAVKLEKIREKNRKKREKLAILARKKELAELKSAKSKTITQIIEFQKQLDGFDELNNAEKLKKEADYAVLTDIIRDVDLVNLESALMKKAQLVDKYNKEEQEIIDEIARDQAQDAKEQSDAEKLEKKLEKENDIWYKKQKERLTEKEKFEKKEREQSEKHFNRLQRFGSAYLDAIIAGQFDAIPKILAQQSIMFGQEIFWDGLKTLLFGISQNTMFPGLGAGATSVGLAEMAIGGTMMGAGAVGLNMMGDSSTASSSSDSAKSAGSKDRQDTQDSLDRQSKEGKANVYQYPDEKAYLDHLQNSNKKVKQNRRNG